MTNAERKPIGSEKDPQVLNFAAELEELSGKFGVFGEAKHTFTASNDKGYERISPELKRRLNWRTGGVAAIVGPGNLFSLLPDLNRGLVLSLDINPKVLEFNKLLAELIAQSDTPDEVLQKLTDVDQMDLERLKLIVRVGIPGVKQFKEEAEVMGADHWTNPERFKEVKRILLEKPIAYVAADVTNPDFIKALRSVITSYRSGITFANLTNIASYSTSVAPVKDWPWGEHPVILHSRNEPPNLKDLWMCLADTPEHYIREAKVSR